MKLKEYITEKEKLELQIYGIINVLEKFCMPFIDHMRRVGLKKWFYRGSDKVYQKKMVKSKVREYRRAKDMSQELQEYIDDVLYKKFKWRPRSEGVFANSNKSGTKHYGAPGIFFPIDKNYKFVYNPDVIDLYTELDDGGGIYDGPPNRSDIRDELENDGYLEREYEDEYGVNSHSGEWYYNDEPTGEYDRRQATEVTIDAIAEDGNISREVAEEEFFEKAALEWMPEMTWDDFLELKVEDIYDNRSAIIDGALRNFTDKNLKKAHSSQVEVIFKCKEYFLVSDVFDEELTNHFLIGNPMKPDFRQKKFPFESDYMFKFAIVK